MAFSFHVPAAFLVLPHICLKWIVFGAGLLFWPHCRSSRHVATASLSGRQTLPALHFAIRNAPYLSQRRKMIPKTTREVNENSLRINSLTDDQLVL
jgi:hypothetical protein